MAVQACGDAHLSNFGIFGSAERRLVFDVNDFDETLPGPWEWDVTAGSQSGSGRARQRVRQLRGWKYSIAIEDLVPRGMHIYGELCGFSLTRARSGDRIAIAPGRPGIPPR